ncbi:MAG: prephenate dehydrogenase [Chloroflexi bacterium]|nr:prephenate dehydrogenase [Chloroflexota bacterium]
MRALEDIDPIFDTIAIVGVGLIGGSLGMAAKKRGLAGRVIGIGRTEQKLMRAKILGAIDDYSLDLANGAAEADLVVICTPVRDVVPTIEVLAPSLKPGAIVTDVGSTKGEITSDAAKVMPDGAHFVGGHPMAGSEQTGVEAAFPDLFLGATYVVTPTRSTDLAAMGKVVAFAEAIGARVEIMSPEEHDMAAAIISHLPHVISGALLQAAEKAQRESGKLFGMAAGSFRDLTRISSSSPELWRDICLTNRMPLLEAIGELQGFLAKFKMALMTGDEGAVNRFFEQACQIRKTYMKIAKD